MAEVYTSPFTVTLASAYTAGSGTLAVSAAAPVAIQSGTFRVRLGNASNTVLKVTGGASTTTWTVVAEFSDANASSGATVYGCELSPGALDQIKSDVKASVGFVLLEQHAASNSASLNFTSCLTSGYDSYLIDLVGIVPVTTNTDLLLRFSTDGGLTYDSTAGHYSFASHSWISSGVPAVTGANSTNSISITGNKTRLNTTASLGGVCGQIRIFLQQSAYTRVLSQVEYTDTFSDPDFSTNTGGTYMQAVTPNAFQLLITSGNIASGTVRVYGMGKS